MSKHYLLVCEGPTDYFIIAAISKRLSEILNSEIKITLLAPQKDATTSSYARHGWTEIKNWCRLYGTKSEEQLSKLPPPIRARAKRLNWRGLLALNKADGLIIQMDTDIAEHVNDPDRFDPAASHRETHCRTAVLSWIGEPAASPKLYLTLTSFALEAWLLSTYPRTDPVFSDLPDNFNFEEISNLEDRLIQLKCNSKKDSKGRRRLSKTERHYQDYAQKISENLELVRRNCISAENLCAYLEV